MSACCLRDSLKLSEEFAVIAHTRCSDYEGGRGLMQKTNAARASHPSRIVIADALTVVFHRRRKIIAQPHSTLFRAGMPRINDNLKLALQGYDSPFPSSSKEGLQRGR
jgi:hypothetical protein